MCSSEQDMSRKMPFYLRKQICADGAESVTSNTSDTVEGNDLLDDNDNLKHLSKTIMRKFWS